MKKSILVIGCGGMGIRHIKALLNTNKCDVSCFDLNLMRAAEAGFIGAIGLISSLDELWKEKFDGVIIATPTTSRLDYVRWCAKNKIPFLIEKPLAISLEEGKKILNLVESSGVIAGAAFPRRNAGAYLKIKQLFQEGKIGELRAYRSNFSQDFRKYRADYSSTYYAKDRLGGGLIMDALSHHLNLATFFCGPIKGVHAISAQQEILDVECEDIAFITLFFESGVLGQVYGNQFQKPNEDYVELIGTIGSIKFDRLQEKISFNNSDSVIWEELCYQEKWDDVLQSQVECFLNMIDGLCKPATSIYEGLQNLEAAISAKNSAKKILFETLSI